MRNSTIRQKIQAGVAHEQHTGQYQQQLECRLSSLRQRLTLPAENPAAALIRFVRQYVESVPTALALISAVSKRLRFHEEIAPMLELAEDYFSSRPQPSGANNGLEALLEEAFLAHRLLEEVNDHHQRQMGHPLLERDSTEDSIIAHILIGNKRADAIEQLVQHAAGETLVGEWVWDALRAQPGRTPAALATRRPTPGTPAVRLRWA